VVLQRAQYEPDEVLADTVRKEFAVEELSKKLEDKLDTSRAGSGTQRRRKTKA